MKQLCHRMS